MKIKKFALVLAAVLLLGCVLAGCESSAGMPNPMVETDAKGFLEQVGAELNVPQGATDVKYFVIDKTLGQMNFKLDNMEYVARVKSTAQFEDISGIHCTWDTEEDFSVGNLAGKEMRGKLDGKTVDLCLWYDVVPGFMYSLSTQADDLDGFDLTAVVQQVYKPMQGDVG